MFNCVTFTESQQKLLIFLTLAENGAFIIYMSCLNLIVSSMLQICLSHLINKNLDKTIKTQVTPCDDENDDDDELFLWYG